MSDAWRTQPRQQRGVPSGGQWREAHRPEGNVALTEPPAPKEAAAPGPAQPERKWRAAGDLGPIQAKRVNEALRALHSEGRTVTELTGVVGGEAREFHTMSLFGPVRPEVVEAERQVGERFGWTASSANYREVVDVLLQATKEAQRSRPVVDKRVTPEEDQRRRAALEARDREQRERAEREEALMAQVRAKAPAGAEAVVVAELQEDTSDAMTDYFANKTLRRVAIGYRFGKREDFAQLRAVAATFPETAHLAAKQSERRDNYSMGAGNYLSDHGSANSGSGWVVRSYPLDMKNPRLTEVALPERPAAPAAPTPAGPVTVRPSSRGREGVVEVAFAERPAPEVISALKAHGFRWAMRDRCWYGSDAAFAETLVASGQQES